MRTAVDAVRALLIAAALCACEGSTPRASAPGQAPVSIDPPPADALIVRPARAQLAPGAAQQFSVTGIASDDAAWSVEEGGAAGTVGPDGSYEAPPAPGVYHVTVASRTDPARRGRSTVVVSAAVGALVLTPASVLLRPGARWTFAARGTAASALTWSVNEEGGGEVDAGGGYTAPAAEGVYHVVVMSADGTSKEAAEVRVTGASGAP
ncbi:MAG: hypothetical protein ACJ79R_14015 [Anaeromyxobacteraceae bacterium]